MSYFAADTSRDRNLYFILFLYNRRTYDQREFFLRFILNYFIKLFRGFTRFKPTVIHNISYFIFRVSYRTLRGYIIYIYINII